MSSKEMARLGKETWWTQVGADLLPLGYVTVYGRVEEVDAVDVMMAVGGKMTGRVLPESSRPALEERARSEQRVVLRVTPESYFP